MGLNTRDGSGIFLSIYSGKLTRTFKEAQGDKTKSRVNKNGNTVHEQYFDSIDGIMTDLKVKHPPTDHPEYGDQYVLTITDGEDVFNINIGWDSRYATSLLKLLPNVKITEKLTLQPWEMADKQKPGKNISGITIRQGGEKILPAYTKENPNGLPEMKQVTVKGKKVWDGYEMNKFLETMALDAFAKAYPKETQTSSSTQEVPF